MRFWPAPAGPGPALRCLRLALVAGGCTLAAGALEAQEIVQGRLTMEIEAQPLADVLEAIAREAGIGLEIDGELGDAEPQTFHSVPLDGAIRQLVGTHSLVMIHAPNAERQLSEVRVYAVEEDPEARRQASAQQARRAERAQRVESAGREVAVAGERTDRAARVQEVRELARSGDPAAVRDLSAILASDDDPAIRRLAVGALAGIGDPGATEPLAQALDDEDRAVRVQVVRALHNLLGDDVAPYLARVVTSDQEPAVRMMAVQMAADLPGGPALEVLQQALNDPDDEIREMAEAALDR